MIKPDPTTTSTTHTALPRRAHVAMVDELSGLVDTLGPARAVGGRARGRGTYRSRADPTATLWPP